MAQMVAEKLHKLDFDDEVTAPFPLETQQSASLARPG